MDLRSCYFCGTVGDALDTHALPRDADEPVRVPLCTDCHAKLTRVLDAIADETNRSEGEGDLDGTPSNRTDTFRGTGEVAFDESGRSVADADRERDGSGRGTAASETSTAAAVDTDPDAGDCDDRTPHEDGDDAGAATEPGSSPDDGPHREDRPDAEDDGGRVGGGDGEPDATDGLRGLDPDDRGRVDTYRKALRLLQNREFPMERAAVVDLLGSAYDLDRSECDRLLDFAVEKELLVEEGGELRRP